MSINYVLNQNKEGCSVKGVYINYPYLTVDSDCHTVEVQVLDVQVPFYKSKDNFHVFLLQEELSKQIDQLGYIYIKTGGLYYFYRISTGQIAEVKEIPYSDNEEIEIIRDYMY